MDHKPNKSWSLVHSKGNLSSLSLIFTLPQDGAMEQCLEDAKQLVYQQVPVTMLLTT